MFLKYPDITSSLGIKNLWIVDSQYQWLSSDYPSVATFRKAGYPLLVSPTIHNKYQIIPDYQRALQNITGLVRTGYREGTLGAITSSWGDGGGESTGHRSGRRIVDLRRTKAADLTDDDYQHMRKVVGSVHRHLEQRPEGDVSETPWRYSLKNWGHEPVR